jgi:hypothetical protein
MYVYLQFNVHVQCIYIEYSVLAKCTKFFYTVRGHWSFLVWIQTFWRVTVIIIKILPLFICQSCASSIKPLITDVTNNPLFTIYIDFITLRTHCTFLLFWTRLFFSVFVTVAVRVRGLFLEDFTGTSLAVSPELSFGTLSSELFTGVLHPEVDGLTPGFFSDGEPERCGCVGWRVQKTGKHFQYRLW